jgi:hypothetical protein
MGFALKVILTDGGRECGVASAGQFDVFGHIKFYVSPLMGSLFSQS